MINNVGQMIVVIAFFQAIFCGVVYYIDNTNGNNSFSGQTSTLHPVSCTLGEDCTDGPWKTILKVNSMTYQPGDKILFRRNQIFQHGTPLIISSSGNSENYIEYGAYGDGSERPIIDPSLPVVPDWVPAPEIGADVFKTTNIDNPGYLSVNNQRIGMISSVCMTEPPDLDRCLNDWSYREFLTQPTDARITLNWSSKEKEIYFWDPIKALCGYHIASGTTYCRFRDGDDPSTMDFRYVPYNGFHTNSGIYVYQKYFIEIRDLHSRNAMYPLNIQGPNCGHVNVHDSYFESGRWTVRIHYYAHDINFHNNEVHLNYYGFDLDTVGADVGYSNEDDYYQSALRYFVYRSFKYILGGSSSDHTAICLVFDGGENSTFHHNHIHGGLVGFTSAGNSGFVKNVSVFSNRIEHFSSVGITIGAFEVGWKIFRNYIFDCAINLRFHRYNEPGDNRQLEIYENLVYNKGFVSSLIFVHHTVGPIQPNLPKVDTYQNTFFGGLWFVYCADSSVLSYHQTGETAFYRNVISSKNVHHVSNEEVCNTPDVWREFDYNVASGGFYYCDYPAHFGAHNYREFDKCLWRDYIDGVSPLPNFRLPNDCPVLQAI